MFSIIYIGPEGCSEAGGGMMAESIILLALIIFALGAMIATYIFRRGQIAFVAAAAWLFLAFFGFQQSASSNPTQITDIYMGLFWLGVAMTIVSALEPLMMRGAFEATEDKEEESTELSDEFKSLRKEMGLDTYRRKKKKLGE